jgi:hypothetical protein
VSLARALLRGALLKSDPQQAPQEASAPGEVVLSGQSLTCGQLSVGGRTIPISCTQQNGQTYVTAIAGQSTSNQVVEVTREGGAPLKRFRIPVGTRNSGTYRVVLHLDKLQGQHAARAQQFNNGAKANATLDEHPIHGAVVDAIRNARDTREDVALPAQTYLRDVRTFLTTEDPQQGLKAARSVVGHAYQLTDEEFARVSSRHTVEALLGELSPSDPQARAHLGEVYADLLHPERQALAPEVPADGPLDEVDALTRALTLSLREPAAPPFQATLLSEADAQVTPPDQAMPTEHWARSGLMLMTDDRGRQVLRVAPEQGAPFTLPVGRLDKPTKSGQARSAAYGDGLDTGPEFFKSVLDHADVTRLERSLGLTSGKRATLAAQYQEASAQAALEPHPFTERAFTWLRGAQTASDRARVVAFCDGLYAQTLHGQGHRHRYQLLFSAARTLDLNTDQGALEFARLGTQLLTASALSRRTRDRAESLTSELVIDREGFGGEDFHAHMTDALSAAGRLAQLEVQLPEDVAGQPGPAWTAHAQQQVEPALHQMLMTSLLSRAASRAGLDAVPTVNLMGLSEKVAERSKNAPGADLFVARGLRTELANLVSSDYDANESGISVETRFPAAAIRSFADRLAVLAGDRAPNLNATVDALRAMADDGEHATLLTTLRVRTGPVTDVRLSPGRLFQSRGSSGEGLADGYADAALSGARPARVTIVHARDGAEEMRTYGVQVAISDAMEHQARAHLKLLQMGARTPLTSMMGELLGAHARRLEGQTLARAATQSAEIRASLQEHMQLTRENLNEGPSRHLGSLMSRNFLDLSLASLDEPARRHLLGILMGGGAGALAEHRNALMGAMAGTFDQVMGRSDEQSAALSATLNDPDLTEEGRREALWQLGHRTVGALLHGPALLGLRALHPDTKFGVATGEGQASGARIQQSLEGRAPQYTGESQREYEQRAAHMKTTDHLPPLTGNLWANQDLGELADHGAPRLDSLGLDLDQLRQNLGRLVRGETGAPTRTARYGALDEVLGQSSGTILGWSGALKGGLLLNPSFIPAREGQTPTPLTHAEVVGAWAWQMHATGEHPELRAAFGASRLDAQAEGRAASLLAHTGHRHADVLDRCLSHPMMGALPPSALELLPSKGTLVDVARNWALMGAGEPASLRQAVESALFERLKDRPDLKTHLPGIITGALLETLKSATPLTREQMEEARGSLRVAHTLTELTASQVMDADTRARQGRDTSELHYSRALPYSKVGELVGVLEGLSHVAAAWGQDPPSRIQRGHFFTDEGTLYASRFVLHYPDREHHVVMSPVRPSPLGFVDGAVEHFEVRYGEDGTHIHHDAVSSEFKNSVSGQFAGHGTKAVGLRRGRGQALVHKKDDDLPNSERLRTLDAVMNDVRKYRPEGTGEATHFYPRVYHLTESYSRVLRARGETGAVGHQIEHRPGSVLLHAMSFHTPHGDNFFGVERAFDADTELLRGRA